MGDNCGGGDGLSVVDSHNKGIRQYRLLAGRRCRMGEIFLQRHCHACIAACRYRSPPLADAEILDDVARRSCRP